MNVNYRVLALDPGGTTGWASYDAEIMPSLDGSTQEIIDHRLTVGQIGPDDHHSDLYALLERAHIHDFTVVCESFEFRQNRQRDNINLMSREYIGVVKLFQAERSVPVVFQTAGLAKGFVSDQKLKVMKWYTPGMQHARDATRHLVYYLVNKQHRHDLVESWKSLA